MNWTTPIEDLSVEELRQLVFWYRNFHSHILDAPKIGSPITGDTWIKVKRQSTL